MHLSKRLPKLLYFALLLSAFPRPASAQSAQQYPELVRLAYVEFFSGDTTGSTISADRLRHEVASANVLQAHLENYIRLASFDESITNLEFTLNPGNHYQVLEWLRAGAVDAGVVSPFMAYLLEKQGIAVPFLEFPGEKRHGSTPVVAASVGGTPESSPLALLDSVLAELYDRAQTVAVSGAEFERPATLFMVSHLSTSGFIAPTLYADTWLTRTEDSLPPSQALTPAAREQFWDSFFDMAAFDPHPWDEDSLQGETGPVFVFSDRGKGADALSLIGGTVLGTWKPFPIEPPTGEEYAPDDPAYLIPNQVLVLRSDLACRLDPRDDDEAHSPQECADAIPIPSVFEHFEAGRQQRFRTRVETTFLSERFDHWYTHGHFEFTLDEVLHFVREDQVRSGSRRLALVLPGGGVKSVYQAQVLGHLYGSCRLVNGHEDEGRAPDCDSPSDSATTYAPEIHTDEEPLYVESVIGTSGGAMVGFLAAMLGPDHNRSLAEDVTALANDPGFMPFDILGAVSVLLILSVLVLSLLFMEAVHPDPDNPEVVWEGDRTRPRGERMLPAHRRFFLAWPLVALPLLLAAIGLGGEETIWFWEAGLYGLTVLLVHFAQTSFRSPRPWAADTDPGPHAAGVRVEAAGLAILGTVLVAVALLGSRLVPGETLSVRLLSVMGATGVLVLYLAYVFDVWAAGQKIRVVGIDEYLESMPLAFLSILAAYLLFIGLVASGFASDLALTRSFWLGLGMSAAVVCGALTFWASRPQRGHLKLSKPGLWLRRHMLWLGESDDGGSWWTSPGNRLLALGSFATLMWTITVVPGLYGNAAALGSFANTVNDRIHDHADSADDHGHEPPLHANLVVTGTLLRDAVLADNQRVPAGDFYFCFAGPTGCPEGLGPRWITGEDEDEDVMIDAVFSSGSPFPVLPAHDAQLPDGSSLPLVDGGYAHNVPYEAALMSGARQVLAVRSSPIAEAPTGADRAVGARALLSRLTRGSGRIFSFLFARAQEVDRNHASGMFVATVAPTTPIDRRFPSLTSFTEATVEWLTNQASHDLSRDRRIGRIESWGTPITSRVLRGT